MSDSASGHGSDGESLRQRRRPLAWTGAVIGAGLTVVGYVMTRQTIPVNCSQFHLAVQLAASDERLGLKLAGCGDLRGFRTTIGWDFAFLAGYGLLLRVGVVVWRGHAAIRTTAIRRIIWLPLVAAALDAVENVLTLALVSVTADGSALHYAGDRIGGTAIATVAWLKWLSLAATAVAVAMAVLALVRSRAGRGSRRRSGA